MDTIPTTIRLRSDQLSSIKENGMNLGEFVREKLDEYFLNEDEINLEIEKIKIKLKKLRKWLKNRPKTGERFIKEEQKLTKKQLLFLQETKVLLQKRPEFLSGRITLFCNNFGILKQLTKKEFLELLDRIPLETKV